MNTSSIFTPEDRAQLRAELLERSRQDQRIVGAAITGSAAIGKEDRWSDIDLAFGIQSGQELSTVLAGWTDFMYQRHGAVHHVDLTTGAWTYRVFFLENTLQVDLAFVEEPEFRGVGPTFKLIHGSANESKPNSLASAETLIGFGWLYALHARSCIRRGQLWRAEYMISALRDHALALACSRHGLSTAHGRGFDQLTAEVTDLYRGSLVRELDAGELSRAFQSAAECLLREIQLTNTELFERLREPVERLLA